MNVRPVDIRLEALTLHGIEAGSGPLALMFHGITANAYVFLPLMERLASEFRCVSFDQRGHGRSGKPTRGYGADAFAEDIAGIVRALDAGPALLIGHSLGARNGLAAAVRNPQAVAGVIAIDFTPYIEDAVFDALEARVGGGDQVFADAAAARAYLAQRYARLPPAAVELRCRYGMVNVAGGLRPLADPQAMRQISIGLREDLVEVLRAVRVPTLLIRGVDSKLVSPDAWQKTKALRPDIAAVELPDCDHYVPEENPDGVAGAVRAFRARVHERRRNPNDG